jgi:hypothetical protein
MIDGIAVCTGCADVLATSAFVHWSTLCRALCGDWLIYRFILLPVNRNTSSDRRAYGAVRHHARIGHTELDGVLKMVQHSKELSAKDWRFGHRRL